MTINRWTLGLISVGLVSLSSVGQAEEKLSAVQTALSSTTLSGYVDTSAQWNIGTGNAGAPAYAFGGPAKADGFNLNVVNLTLEKALDEGQWSAGYRVDLAFGPDGGTTGLGTGSDIRQAYVAMRVPVGNGLDLKLGTWDTIIGYESYDSYKNPNFTRSGGYTIEPKTHTGLLAEYVLSDVLTFKAGIANDFGPAINNRSHFGSSGAIGGPLAGAFNAFYANADAAFSFPPGTTASGLRGFNARAESHKTYMGAITLNAPESAGALHGSSLTVGAIHGNNASVGGSGVGDTSTHLYVGGNIATPVEGLGLGAAFDYMMSDLNSLERGLASAGLPGIDFDLDMWSAALYASFKATEKLGLHVRAEYFEPEISVLGTSSRVQVGTLTGTVQYDLWKNVLTRLEVRWDRDLGGSSTLSGGRAFGAATNEKNSVIVAANVVYRF